MKDCLDKVAALCAKYGVDSVLVGVIDYCDQSAESSLAELLLTALNEATAPSYVCVSIGQRTPRTSREEGARYVTPIGWKPANKIPGCFHEDGDWFHYARNVAFPLKATLICRGIEKSVNAGDHLEVPITSLEIMSPDETKSYGPVQYGGEL